MMTIKRGGVCVLFVLCMPSLAWSSLPTKGARHSQKRTVLRSSEGIQTATTDADLPSMKTLRRFAIPALGLWISGPVLTLIDTAAVGQTAKSSALEIAALGPATSVCDATGFFSAFLNVAATNLLARAGSQGERKDITARGASLALVFGAMSTGLLWLTLDSILRVFVGGDEAVIALSSVYVQVRALGLPFLLLGNVLTAACLGTKDSITPLKATAASAIANIIGDYVAVVLLGRGVRGAAEATMLAQMISASFLLYKCLGPKGALHGWRPKLWNPRVINKSFRAFAAPVLVLVFSKVASFGVMTHAAAKLGDLALASHQLAFTIYLLTSLVLEALAGQTAQAFIPSLFNKRPDLAAKLSTRLGKFTALSGILVTAVSALVALFGAPIFSPDPKIAVALASLAIPLAASILFHGAVAHGEGILLATADLAFVGAAYAVSALIFPVFILMAIYAPHLLPGSLFSITQGKHIWAAFCTFQIIRAIVFQLRVKQVFASAKKTASHNSPDSLTSAAL